MTWLETVGNVITTGALCTWAAYDLYRRWNGPARVMQQTQKLVQNGGARSVTDASSGSRAALESLPPPGIRAVMHSGDGWQTTTIAFQDGTQEALVTLQELLRAPGGLDPEHPATLNLLEHLHQDVEAGGSLMGNPALRRIAQAGPRDFTEADYEMLSALDEGVRRRRPLSQAQLELLPTHVHSSRQEGLKSTPEEERSCSICLEGFKDREVVKTLPCLHHFHAGCIEEWLRREGQAVSCPVCKTAVFEGQ